MSDDFDMVAMQTVQNQYLGGDASLACSAETQALIDKKVVELVKKEHEKAKKLLTENKAKLDKLAERLYKQETITGDEFMELVAEVDKEEAAKKAASEGQQPSDNVQTTDNTQPAAE
jgi:cell division protease FtsH